MIGASCTKHGVGVDAETKIGLAQPVLEVVAGGVKGKKPTSGERAQMWGSIESSFPREVRDFVLVEAGGVQDFARSHVKVRDAVIIRDVVSVVACTASNKFAAETRQRDPSAHDM